MLGTCCATLLQRCKQAAWRHLEAANCHVFRHRWKTLDSGLVTLASVWQRLNNTVQRWGKYNIAWLRCTTLCCVAQLMATLYHRWRTLDSHCATLLQRCKKAAQRHLLCGQYHPRQRGPYKWSISILPRSQFYKKQGKLAFSTSCTAVRPHRRLRNDAWRRDS